MAWPVPTIEELAVYTGRAAVSFTSYATAALLQATVMFTVYTELTAGDYATVGTSAGMVIADAQQLANMGVMAMGDHIYLRQPYQQVIASPLQNETIGSYSYAKPFQEIARNAQAMEVTAEKTGVEMFDLAVRVLARRSKLAGVYSGQIAGFDHTARDDMARVMWHERDQRLVLLGPADRDQVDMQFFSVSGEMFPADPA